MFWKKLDKRWTRSLMGVFLIATVLVTALGITTPSQAHCDSEKGPVAAAAQHALESGNVNLILPYVQLEAETELIAAFKQAVAVRKSGGEALKLADRYFLETAVRLHRAGEGAPYSGVTDENTPQAILTADKAMADGSMQGVYTMLNQAIQKGVQEKYHAVVEAREEATRLNTVEAHRERVEAELIFEKYVYELYTTISAEQPHTEGAHH